MRRAAVGLFSFFFLFIRLHGEEVVFATYNVENYLPMSRSENGKRVANAGKPESEIAAVVKVLKKVRPDILGLNEMGDESMLEDLRKRLKAVGLDYPHHEWMQGFDEVRHVCLLSRFPIVKRNSRSEIPFPINGHIERMNRGILDVTVEINPTYRLRLVGSHLKSRRPVPEYDEMVMRAKEAWFLRDHVVRILEETPDTNLLLFGDFNDTKNEYPVRTLTGRRGSSTHMLALDLADSRGELWTHYWKTADSYSRIDYIMVNRGLEKEIVLKKSGVNDSLFWPEASDHRAVYTTISATDKP
jgi:endonuclease/exonuclease/phosphatase family metal-dependent hydrolase